MKLTGRMVRGETYPRIPATPATASNALTADLSKSRNLIWYQGDAVDIVLDNATPNTALNAAANVNPVVDGVERFLHVYGQFWLRSDTAFVADARLDVTIDGTFGARTTSGFTYVPSINVFAGQVTEWPIPFDLLFQSGAANAGASALQLTLSVGAFPAAGTLTIKTGRPICCAELLSTTLGTLAP